MVKMSLCLSINCEYLDLDKSGSYVCREGDHPCPLDFKMETEEADPAEA